jgi:predicted Na+-dependent transporter
LLEGNVAPVVLSVLVSNVIAAVSTPFVVVIVAGEPM